MIHWELCKKLKFDLSNKWYMHNPEYVLENGTYKLFWDFEMQTDHQISVRRPDLIINKKKRELAELLSRRTREWKWKTVKRGRSTSTLVGNCRKLSNMNVTIIPIVIGALGTVTKGLVQGLNDLEIMGRVEIVQTTALLRSARIRRSVQETWGDLLSLKLQWETIS